METFKCANCGANRGFKRNIGVGTLIAIILTMGWYIILIPFYPKRCIVCGGTEIIRKSFWSK